MKEEKIFKKALFGGFDQEDVIDYLKEVNIVTTQKLDRMKKLEEENKALKEELENIEREFNDVIAINEELKNEIAELNETKQKKTEDSVKRHVKVINTENKSTDFMIESLAYSEKCMENARNVTRAIAKETLFQVEKVKRSISLINDEVNVLSNGLTKCMFEAENRMKGLDDNLQKVCDSFQGEINNIISTSAQKNTANKDDDEITD